VAASRILNRGTEVERERAREVTANRVQGSRSDVEKESGNREVDCVNRMWISGKLKAWNEKIQKRETGSQKAGNGKGEPERREAG
jgi:hypothetical protein